MKLLYLLLTCLCLNTYAQNKTLEVKPLPIGPNKRAAVILANQNYAVDQYDLRKTYNDADDMKAALERLGFTVLVFKKDLDRRTLDQQLKALPARLQGYEVAFFYYSGHGGFYDEQNYMIPADTPSIEDNVDIQTYGISLANVYRALAEGGVKTSIVVSDACRNQVYGKGGLASGMVLPAENPRGTFTMFATRSGKVARENVNGRNSYFTQELLKNLETPNLTLNQIFKATRQSLQQATAQFKEPQVPGCVDELDNEMVLIQTNPPSPPKKFLDLPFAEMAYVPGGTFEMGSEEGPDHEQPVHTVTVSSFWMGKYEVTVSQFAQFVAESNYQTDAEKEGTSRIFNPKINRRWKDSTGINWRHDPTGTRRPTSDYNHPVIHVSHNDAVAFCAWLSKKENRPYRLPTEAEWEYAAGNGWAHKKYSWGNGEPTGKAGNVADETAKKIFPNRRSIYTGYTDGYTYTSPVGVFDPNGLGLHDMIGNVWEWCSDWYDYDYYANSNNSQNPNGPNTGWSRVLRGGSWGTDPHSVRVASRRNNAPEGRDFDLGFRLVSPSQ